MRGIFVVTLSQFRVLSLGFDVKALIPQGLTVRPNYFGLLNNLMTLIICESLREISEMACVTSAWSSRGQNLNLSAHRLYLASFIAILSFSFFLLHLQGEVKKKQSANILISTPIIFVCLKYRSGS